MCEDIWGTEWRSAVYPHASKVLLSFASQQSPCSLVSRERMWDKRRDSGVDGINERVEKESGSRTADDRVDEEEKA